MFSYVFSLCFGAWSTLVRDTRYVRVADELLQIEQASVRSCASCVLSSVVRVIAC